jgi:hypothetical protein
MHVDDRVGVVAQFGEDLVGVFARQRRPGDPSPAVRGGAHEQDPGARAEQVNRELVTYRTGHDSAWAPSTTSTAKWLFWTASATT